jgi:hypothetical protein
MQLEHLAEAVNICVLDKPTLPEAVYGVGKGSGERRRGAVPLLLIADIA